jgi:hypothetical protein
MTLPTIGWKTGFEIELMMPQGRSRADLATRIAARHGGRVVRFFHPQSEPSKVPGRPSFDNLTLGFRALDDGGGAIASFVDDLTLQAGLQKSAPPREGWYRIVSDDGRLLQLVMRTGDAESDLETALKPIAELFGTVPEHHDGMLRVVDERKVSVVLGAPLPGERERPCEIVTVPIETGHGDILSGLMADAIAEGCTIPLESATHVHFDAAPLASAKSVAALVRVLWKHGDALKRLVGFNPNCVRLGRWPEALPALTEGEAFRALDWTAAKAALMATGLTKYCDYNLLNLASDNRRKLTFELRVLPTSMSVEPVLFATALFEGILRWSIAPGALDAPLPGSLGGLIGALDLAEDVERYWIGRAFTMPHVPGGRTG